MENQPSEPVESLSGTVQSIVFHNEENGYTIMQVKRPKEPELTTVLGVLPSVVEGEELTAHGEWITDRRFGKQFKAGHIQPHAPESEPGIERFLASGLIDGVGKLYAKRIVKKFGKETFEIIENASQRLEEVEGIGKKRRIQIKDSWKEQKAIRDIMIFLHEQGLSTARAMRLFRNYGQDAVTVLRQNPYQLAKDLPGVGFKTADDIARKMGQADNSPQRIMAGIHHTLDAASQNGHSALPREDLVRESTEILGSDEEAITRELDALVLDERLMEDGGLVYRRDLFEAECIVAKRIRDLCDHEADYPELDADAAIRDFEEAKQFQLGEEQAEAVRSAAQHRAFILTGGPGVGKTTIVNAILGILASKNIHPVLCAPTGRAAKRLAESTGREASTIHRLLEFQPQGGFLRNAKLPLDGKLFVVDEASMLDLPLMAAFLQALPPAAHLILVGDVDQLPSVGPGTVLRDLIESKVVPVARLKQIFRQAQSSRIVTAAHSVNQGSLPDLTPDKDADFFYIERQNPEATIETLVHLIRERIPNRFEFDPRSDIQVLVPMNRNTLGTAALNQTLQDALNPPGDFKFEIERFGKTFRVGDKVIQTRNNYDNEVFNGDIGLISEITTEPAKIKVRFEGQREITYDPGDLDELQLAYAITIHKSQGSEFPCVIVPLSNQQYILLQKNLIYTGMTRGKKLVILVGEKSALEMAVRNVESAHRWSGLRERVKKQAAPEPSPDDEFQKLEDRLL